MNLRRYIILMRNLLMIVVLLPPYLLMCVIALGLAAPIARMFSGHFAGRSLRADEGLELSERERSVPDEGVLRMTRSGR
jgi:hypothetical protein